VRIDRRLLGWGVFFVLLGGIPLLVQSGVLDPGLLAGAWHLWPLVIVGLGLGLILGRTPFAVAASSLPARRSAPSVATAAATSPERASRIEPARSPAARRTSTCTCRVDTSASPQPTGMDGP